MSVIEIAGDIQEKRPPTVADRPSNKTHILLRVMWNYCINQNIVGT